MTWHRPHITAKIGGRPVYPILRQFAVGYFVITLLCDLLYLFAQSNAALRFATSGFGLTTQWVLGVGLAMAVLGGVAAYIDFRGEPRFRNLPDFALYVDGSALLLAIEGYNFYLRYVGGSEAIGSSGLLLSLLALVVLIAIPSKNWNEMYH